MEGITVCQPPLPAALIDELLVFWQDIFQTDYRMFRGILNGDELEHNLDVFYLVGDGDRTVGSCHLTFPVADPALGGLGEVATAPAARGRGTGLAIDYPSAKLLQDYLGAVTALSFSDLEATVKDDRARGREVRRRRLAALGSVKMAWRDTT